MEKFKSRTTFYSLTIILRSTHSISRILTKGSTRTFKSGSTLVRLNSSATKNRRKTCREDARMQLNSGLQRSRLAKSALGQGRQRSQSQRVLLLALSRTVFCKMSSRISLSILYSQRTISARRIKLPVMHGAITLPIILSLSCSARCLRTRKC